MYEDIYDANNLYKSFLKCRSGVTWKESVQNYEINLLKNLYYTQQELKNETYKQKEFHRFEVRERGKVRPVKSLCIKDRVVMNALCEVELWPKLKPYLIYDNGASMKGKGVDFHRKRIKVHLNQFYQKYGDNNGYILLMDFSKFFDNIEHKRSMEMLQSTGKFDKRTLKLVEDALYFFRPDVSYMSDKEYENAMNVPFCVLEHHKIPQYEFTGEKYLDKVVGLGSQLSQVLGVYYPKDVDNYIRNVASFNWHGRYMDDTDVIARDKKDLEDLLSYLIEHQRDFGLFINPKKTKICPLSSFIYLKLHYSLKPNGEIQVVSSAESFHRMKKKYSRLRRRLDSGKITQSDIDESYRSWRGSVQKYGNKYRIRNADKFFKKTYPEGKIKYERRVQDSGSFHRNLQSKVQLRKRCERFWRLEDC